MKEIKEEYKDFVAFLYDNREKLPPDLRAAIEWKMTDILINDLIDRIANILVKENKNDSK